MDIEALGDTLGAARDLLQKSLSTMRGETSLPS